MPTAAMITAIPAKAQFCHCLEASEAPVCAAFPTSLTSEKTGEEQMSEKKMRKEEKILNI